MWIGPAFIAARRPSCKREIGDGVEVRLGSAIDGLYRHALMHGGIEAREGHRIAALRKLAGQPGRIDAAHEIVQVRDAIRSGRLAGIAILGSALQRADRDQAARWTARVGEARSCLAEMMLKQVVQRTLARVRFGGLQRPAFAVTRKTCR